MSEVQKPYWEDRAKRAEKRALAAEADNRAAFMAGYECAAVRGTTPEDGYAQWREKKGGSDE